MDYNNRYIRQSLELHLFFARIMKEHSIFLKAGSTPINASFAQKAEFYKEEFEKLLCRAVSLGDGIVSCKTLHSGELFTEFTSKAEAQTERFTGIPINRGITLREERLCCGKEDCFSRELFQQVRSLNQAALGLVDGLIALKEKILSQVLCCQMFTMNYPLLLEHIIREAKLYREYICKLEAKGVLDCRSVRQMEQFWNRIMMEHALFIRGLLDPSENDLIEAADSFARDYERLLENCREAHGQTLAGTTESSLAETLKFRDFKAAGAKGIQDCQIRSIILPLLADHVLREANHYLRLLGE